MNVARSELRLKRFLLLTEKVFLIFALILLGAPTHPNKRVCSFVGLFNSGSVGPSVRPSHSGLKLYEIDAFNL